MKKVLITAIGALAITGTVAAIGIVPSFAAYDDFQEVQVTVLGELALTADDPLDIITLTPSVGTADTDTGSNLEVTANVGWKLQYQAVAGLIHDDVAAVDDPGEDAYDYTNDWTDSSETTPSTVTAAAGTNLGTTGFADTGGYTYAGFDTAATTGNTWGLQIAIDSGTATLGNTGLGITLQNIATGTSTSGVVFTPTYSAYTDGGVASGDYFGTILYRLSQNI